VPNPSAYAEQNGHCHEYRGVDFHCASLASQMKTIARNHPIGMMQPADNIVKDMVDVSMIDQRAFTGRTGPETFQREFQLATRADARRAERGYRKC
jgi:hypothetical protein